MDNFFKSWSKKTKQLPVETKSTSQGSVTFTGNLFDYYSGVNVKDPVKAYNVLPDVFLLTDYVITQIAKLPLKFVTSNGDEIPEERQTDLKNLIKQPNYYQNWAELIKQYFAFYEVLGNSYLHKTKSTGFSEPQSIFCVPAQGMCVNMARDKNTTPAWLNSVSGYKFSMGGLPNNFATEEILHKRYINLNYQGGVWVYGVSKYIPAEKINTDLAAIYDSRTSIIANRGALGFLSNNSDIPDEEQTKIVQEALNNGTFGVMSGQTKIAASTEQLSWVQMTMGIGELQLIENANYDFNKLCQLNGIDPVLLSTEGSTYANKEFAIKQFLSNVLVPKVNDFYQDLNEWISPDFNGEMVLPDWSAVKELQEDRTELTNDLDKQIRASMITPKKAQEMLYGEVDNPAPDEYFFTTNVTTVDKVVKEVEEPETVEEVVTEETIKHLYNGSTAKTIQHAN